MRVWRFSLGSFARRDKDRSEHPADVVPLAIPKTSQLLSVGTWHEKQGPSLYALVDEGLLEFDRGPLRIWLVPTGQPVRDDAVAYVGSFHQDLDLSVSPRIWHVFKLEG